MHFVKKDYTNDMEILDTMNNLVTKGGTILASNITADSEGNKYVKAGTLIDKDGKVVTQTGTTGSETLSTTPVGIVYKTVNAKNGDAPVSLVIEGYLRTDRVLSGFADKAITAIKTALPNIKFM